MQRMQLNSVRLLLQTTMHMLAQLIDHERDADQACPSHRQNLVQLYTFRCHDYLHGSKIQENITIIDKRCASAGIYVWQAYIQDVHCNEGIIQGSFRQTCPF